MDTGRIRAVIDLTTTEICDLLPGGVQPADPDRLGAIARTRVPYVGSCGALDMVNFGARSARTLDACVALINEWSAAALSVREDVIVLCHGGPIAMPEDVATILRGCRHCHGFFGASSMERLPLERAITEQVQRFKTIRR